MKRYTKCQTHVQREARRVLLEVTRAQRCLARCLARADEAKATEAEVRKISQLSTLVERMIEAFNAAKSDAELSAAMRLVARLTALEEIPSLRLQTGCRRHDGRDVRAGHWIGQQDRA
jgi:hypothetical protein